MSKSHERGSLKRSLEKLCCFFDWADIYRKMDEMDDIQLLREYAEWRSEAAFATLVSRHIDLVYSSAMRQVGNHHAAEEITQSVFLLLARKAGALDARTVVPVWLFRTARLTAANYLRAEIRRTRRELEAYMQSNQHNDSDQLWHELAPLLNDAVAGLRETDREAIVLRFLKGKDYKELAAALGTTEPAAQMRVSRALEKLRRLFAKQGVVVPTAALAGLLAANATQAAPAGMAATVATAAIHGAALTASHLTLLQAALKFMAWTKFKIAVGVGVVVLFAYQHRQNALLAEQIAAGTRALRSGAETAAVQESRIRELQGQTSAIANSGREQQQELARLRARRKTNASPAAAQAGIAPTTVLSAALEDPFTREAMLSEFTDTARRRWRPLVEQLKLSADAAAKLYQIGSDWCLKNVETIAAFTAEKITANAAVETATEAEQDARNELRALLGDDAMSKFDACNRTFPARALDDQFNQQLGFFHLDDQQRSRLRDLINSQPYEVAAGLAGDLSVSQMVNLDEMNRCLTEQKQANQSILQDAAEFLQPDQVDALRQMQQFNESQQQRSILRFLRKLRIDPHTAPML
jgi:RNA polymerase sigma factor (sigma-70 family)